MGSKLSWWLAAWWLAATLLIPLHPGLPTASCTENASRGGGMLLDLEINTARRFWGKSKVRDVSKIEFEVLADD